MSEWYCTLILTPPSHSRTKRKVKAMTDNTYISLYGKCGKIHIFKQTIRAIGQPKFIRFRINPDGRILLEPYHKITLTSFRVPKDLDEMTTTMEVSTTALIRIIFQEFNFDLTRSYRIGGYVYEDKHIAIFHIASAELISDENKIQNFPTY